MINLSSILLNLLLLQPVHISFQLLDLDCVVLLFFLKAVNISKNCIYLRSEIQKKYSRFRTLGFQDIEIRKSEFVAKTQFLILVSFMFWGESIGEGRTFIRWTLIHDTLDFWLIRSFSFFLDIPTGFRPMRVLSFNHAQHFKYPGFLFLISDFEE